MPYAIHVGLAGWAIRKEQSDLFGEAGSHLQRYAARFATVEINSSFYRPHQHDTYVRWSDSVPGGFRFSVKMPRWLTHDRCLADTGDDLRQFLREVSGLGPKLGCILVQLPPGLPYDPRTVETFCSALRSRHRGPIAWEPRHPTWFTGAADRRLEAHGMARVAADPICGEGGGDPGGSERVTYFRLQGSPVMYHSSYGDAYLDALARRLLAVSARAPAWCIFDNTARGAAATDAVRLMSRLDALAREGDLAADDGVDGAR